MLPQIRSVLGDRPPSQGRILMHEHIVIGWGGSENDPLARLDVEGEIRRVSADLRELRETWGVTCIVDASASDMGRDVEFDRRVSEASQVDIVACTGLYKEGLGLPYYWKLATVEELADFFEFELVEGVKDTGVRCGVIKVASHGATLSDAERSVFRAAGQVSARTGAPIITHTDPEGWATCNVGAMQLDVLLDAGADPSRVAIGHACGTADLDYLSELCDAGAYVAFDRVGSYHIRPDETRAATVSALVGAGYGTKVLLSHDHQAVWRRRGVPQGATQIKKDFGLMFREFLPRLVADGLTSAQIDSLCSENPTRLLAWP